MGVLIQNEQVVGGLDAAVAAKIGTATLTTTASDLSGAVNELDAELGNETLPDSSKTVKGNINSLKQSLSDLTPLEKTASGAIATFNDGSDLPMPSLKVAIEPQQNLHGYDSPWVGGSGKNKLPLTVDNIKALNGGANTWNGNTKTINDVTFTILTDAANNVIGINANGTANGNASLNIDSGDLSTYQGDILNGCPSGGSTSTYRLFCQKIESPYNIYVIDTGDGAEFPAMDGTQLLIIRIYNGYNAQNVKFYPMIRLSTESSTFAPYSNICPISGWDDVNVVVSPLNISQLYNGQIYGDGTWVENNARLTNVQTAQSNVYFLKAGTYTLNYDKLNSNAPDLKQCSALTKDDNYTIIDNFANTWNSVPFTFTLAQDGYLYFTIRINANTNINPSDYRAKILGQTYTIDLDGTRYGGEVDVVNGIMTINRASIKLNDLNWTKQNTSSNNWRFTSSQSIQNIKLPTSVSSKIDNLCSVYQNVTANETWTADKTGIAINTDGTLMICDLNQADTTALGAVIANQTYCYELATPQTIQLTPTQVNSLLGVNNIWADTGDIKELVYFRNTNSTQAIKDIIDTITAKDIAINTPDEMTATNVQEAIDEHTEMLAEQGEDISEIKQSLSDLATVDIGDSPSVLSVNGTFQIPANVWKHNIIIISARRQGLGNSTVFRKSDLASFDSGFNLMASNTESYRLKCSSTGVLTLISKTSGLNEPFIMTTGVF